MKEVYCVFASCAYTGSRWIKGIFSNKEMAEDYAEKCEKHKHLIDNGEAGPSFLSFKAWPRKVDNPVEFWKN